LEATLLMADDREERRESPKQKISRGSGHDQVVLLAGNPLFIYGKLQ